MKRGIIRGIIIGLVLFLILIGTAFYRFQQKQKAIERLGNEFTSEKLLQMVEEQCNQLVTELKDENECQQLKKLDDKDVCYYCFAVQKSDPLLCEKIQSGTFWMEECKKKLMAQPKIEEKTPEGEFKDVQEAKLITLEITPSQETEEGIVYQEGAKAIATGKNLAKVEFRQRGGGQIYTSPEGGLVGTGKKTETKEGKERWELLLPSDRLIPEFCAIGFGVNGEKIGEICLPNVFGQQTIAEKEETECDKWLKECVIEGGYPCGPCGCADCCAGLVKRYVIHPYRSESNEIVCLENMTAYICVKCGDGICGTGEDWCICPEDCSKPNPGNLELRNL